MPALHVQIPQVQHALDLLDRMEKEDIAPDATTLNTVMGACGRGGRPAEARNILESAFERYGVERDVVSYNALLMGLARSQPQASRTEFDESADDGPEAVDSVVPEMREVLQEMRAEGLKPDRYTYNNLINALARAGDADDAIGVLREMQAAGAVGYAV